MTLVHSSPDYEEQHLVANGASELLLQAFEKRGQHARSAFGVAQLPFGVCVEIEMIVELDSYYKRNGSITDFLRTTGGAS